VGKEIQENAAETSLSSSSQPRTEDLNLMASASFFEGLELLRNAEDLKKQVLIDRGVRLTK
jgi:hypothetical protein